MLLLPFEEDQITDFAVISFVRITTRRIIFLTKKSETFLDNYARVIRSSSVDPMPCFELNKPITMVFNFLKTFRVQTQGIISSRPP